MLSRAATIFWRIYSPIALALGIGMLVFLCAFWTPFAVLLNFVLPLRERHRIGRLSIRIGLNFYLWCLSAFCGCRFSFPMKKNRLLSEPALIIANHPSLLDALLLLALIPNTICVMKSSLLDNPLLGASAKLAGFIRNSDPFDMIAHGKEAIEERANLLIFPEGTRTSQLQRVNQLNQSVALLASKLNLPIRSYIISYDQCFLGKIKKHYSMPKLPMTITVKPGKVFYSNHDAELLTRDIEDYFNSEI